jgi:tetratricopeptide (TPR) repeat protein
MSANAKQTVILILVLILGFSAIFGLSNFIAKVKPEIPETYTDEDLSLQAAKLKGYSLGFEGLIADWYWMNSLQYLGDKIVKSKTETIDIGDLRGLNPRLLYPMLDSATTLDPKFTAVYSFGAVVLPAIDAQQAIKITEKGIENNPNDWRLYHQLGYIYWRMKDYEKAAEVYEAGSKLPDAPSFMKSMVANLKNEGGSRETARQIYTQLATETEDKQAKESAKLRLLQLDSLDEQDAVNSVLKTFKEKNGRCANSLSEIFPYLKDVKLPNNKDFRIDKSGNIVDPSDAPYLLKKETCEIDIDRTKSKLP